MAVPAPAPPVAAAKADLSKRFIAALIDIIPAFVVGLIPVIGGVLGAAYILVRDGLELDFADRRSIGKKVMKLRPVRLDGQPMNLETSIKRNLPFCVGVIGMIFSPIPLLGLLIAIVVGILALIIALIELLLVVSDAEGRRMGDKFAGTKVIEVNE